jgi:tetrathionate reductase subunit B
MSDSKHTDQARREFLNNSAKLAAGVTLAPGVMLYGVAQARPEDQPVPVTRFAGAC